MFNPHRIMTLNINGIQGDDANSWIKRAPLNLKLINRYKPDILSLQEASLENLDTFRKAFTDYTLFQGNCYGDTPPQEYSSILYSASRYELMEKGEFWFSDTPDIESIDWGVDYPMGATWVKLKCLQTGKQLIHLNTHFEDGPDGELSRVRASQLIISRLERIGPNLPVVLSGDFNCNPWSAPYQVFLENGFTDTYRAAGNADSVNASTMHLYQGQDYFSLDFGGSLFWRVDWILARGGERPVQTIASAILRDAELPTYPSDHFPVLSEIVLL